MKPYLGSNSTLTITQMIESTKTSQISAKTTSTRWLMSVPTWLKHHSSRKVPTSFRRSWMCSAQCILGVFQSLTQAQALSKVSSQDRTSSLTCLSDDIKLTFIFFITLYGRSINFWMFKLKFLNLKSNRIATIIVKIPYNSTQARIFIYQLLTPFSWSKLLDYPFKTSSKIKLNSSKNLINSFKFKIWFFIAKCSSLNHWFFLFTLSLALCAVFWNRIVI